MSEDRIEESLKALRLTKPQARIPESSSTIKVYASYAEISRLCKMPYSTVRNHCLRVIGQSKRQSQSGDSAIGKFASAKKIQKTRTPMPIDKCFKAEHVEFLVGEECLRQWSGLSLRGYVDLFHTVPIDVKP